jgi:alpha-1,2-mannosyltransferase
MLNKVRELRPDYNNNEQIAASKTISALKLLYYKIFALSYSFAGLFADVVLVNSTWTRSNRKTISSIS